MTSPHDDNASVSLVLLVAFAVFVGLLSFVAPFVLTLPLSLAATGLGAYVLRRTHGRRWRVAFGATLVSAIVLAESLLLLANVG
jgi:hypothetical protein